MEVESKQGIARSLCLKREPEEGLRGFGLAVVKGALRRTLDAVYGGHALRRGEREAGPAAEGAKPKCGLDCIVASASHAGSSGPAPQSLALEAKGLGQSVTGSS